MWHEVDKYSSSVFSKCAWNSGKSHWWKSCYAVSSHRSPKTLPSCTNCTFFADKNVAQGRPVAQSSTLNEELHGLYGNPEKAIDESRASEWSQNSCSHTLEETNPWWRVDLPGTHKVNSVKITNRKDCCADRINGAEIRVGNSLNDNGNGNPVYVFLTC